MHSLHAALELEAPSIIPAAVRVEVLAVPVIEPAKARKKAWFMEVRRWTSAIQSNKVGDTIEQGRRYNRTRSAIQSNISANRSIGQSACILLVGQYSIGRPIQPILLVVFNHFFYWSANTTYSIGCIQSACRLYPRRYNLTKGEYPEPAR